MKRRDALIPFHSYVRPAELADFALSLTRGRSRTNVDKWNGTKHSNRIQHVQSPRVAYAWLARSCKGEDESPVKTLFCPSENFTRAWDFGGAWGTQRRKRRTFPEFQNQNQNATFEHPLHSAANVFSRTPQESEEQLTPHTKWKLPLHKRPPRFVTLVIFWTDSASLLTYSAVVSPLQLQIEATQHRHHPLGEL